MSQSAQKAVAFTNIYPHGQEIHGFGRRVFVSRPQKDLQQQRDYEKAKAFFARPIEAPKR